MAISMRPIVYPKRKNELISLLKTGTKAYGCWITDWTNVFIMTKGIKFTIEVLHFLKGRKYESKYKPLAHESFRILCETEFAIVSISIFNYAAKVKGVPPPYENCNFRNTATNANTLRKKHCPFT